MPAFYRFKAGGILANFGHGLQRMHQSASARFTPQMLFVLAFALLGTLVKYQLQGSQRVHCMISRRRLHWSCALLNIHSLLASH